MICKIMSREREPTHQRRFSDREHMIPCASVFDVNMSTYWTNLIKPINLDTLSHLDRMTGQLFAMFTIP